MAFECYMWGGIKTEVNGKKLHKFPIDKRDLKKICTAGENMFVIVPQSNGKCLNMLFSIKSNECHGDW